MTVDLDNVSVRSCYMAILKERRVRIEGLDIYYGLYELKAGVAKRYLIIVSDSDEMVCQDFASLQTAEKFYILVSENEVDTASFDGIARDFLYANNML